MAILEAVTTHEAPKIRRSLLLLSTFTIIISTLNIDASNLNLLGIQVEIEHSSALGLSRFATLILAAIFCLRSAVGFVRLAYAIRSSSLSRRERKDWSNWASDWGFDVPTMPSGDPPEQEKREIEERYAYKNAQLERQRDASIALISNVNDLVIDFVIPLGFAAVAIVAPQSVATMADALF